MSSPAFFLALVSCISLFPSSFVLKTVHNIVKFLVVFIYFVYALRDMDTVAKYIPIWNASVAVATIGLQSARDELIKWYCKKDSVVVPAANRLVDADRADRGAEIVQRDDGDDDDI